MLDVGAAFFHAEGAQIGAFVGYFIGFGYAYGSRIKDDGNRYISQGYFIADKGGYYFGTMAKEGGTEALGRSGVPTSLDFASTMARVSNRAGLACGWAGKIETLPSLLWTTPGRIR